MALSAATHQEKGVNTKLLFVVLSAFAVACAAQSANTAEKDGAKAPATHAQMEAMQSQMQAMHGQMDAMQEQMRTMMGQMQQMTEMHAQMQQNMQSMRGMMGPGGAQGGQGMQQHGAPQSKAEGQEAKPAPKPDAPAGGDHAAHH